MTDISEYEDIIYLPHHVSKYHRQLGRDSYAAQFSPFAALSGYDGIVAESARATDERYELDDYAKLEIEKRLYTVFTHLDEDPSVEIRYFVPDRSKSGGAYVTVAGKVKKYDKAAAEVVFDDGTRVPAADIYGITGGVIEKYLPDG